MAGATTFAAMAYIIAVNPAIMSNAGMDRADLVIATALAAIFGCVMMGLTANLPLAVAPAMGSNVIFTYVIVKQMGMPWQGALAMVAFTGVLFLILSLSKLRETVAKDVPEVVKIGIQAAVGDLDRVHRAARRRLHRAKSVDLHRYGFVEKPGDHADAGRNPAHPGPGGPPHTRRLDHVDRRIDHCRAIHSAQRHQDGHIRAVNDPGLAALADQHLHGARLRLPLQPFRYCVAAAVLLHLR